MSTVTKVQAAIPLSSRSGRDIQFSFSSCFCSVVTQKSPSPQVNTEEFEAAIQDSFYSATPLVVDMFATWCAGAC